MSSTIGSDRGKGNIEDAIAQLLPTPVVNDMGAGKTVDDWDAWTDKMHGAHGNGNGNGKSLAIEAQRDFRTYQAAVDRWASVIGRPAPNPTIPGKTGPLLSPRFCEWLMGWPDGWVCDTDGISHSAALKIAGNGVVPHQAALALHLLGVSE